jgi:type IV pilus assembly protein PilV
MNTVRKSIFRRRKALPARNHSAGFSMIEVLVALIVLALGLLGFALLQTMNLRYAQSANYRTHATNLAYDLLDLARANRVLINQYTQVTPGSFAGVTGRNCATTTGATDPAANIAAWRCKVRAALGEDALAEVTVPNPGEVNVRIQWGDERWTPGDETREFEVRTRL